MGNNATVCSGESGLIYEYKIEPNSEYASTHPTISVTTLHLSCKSDVGNGSGWSNYYKMGGIIIYSLGSYQNKVRVKVKPGYIFIKHTNKHYRESDDGQTHGTLCRLLLGHQPTAISYAGGCISGFGMEGGKLKFNSCCNAGQFYSDRLRAMGSFEQEVVSKAIGLWRSGKAGGQNLSVSSLGIYET